MQNVAACDEDEESRHDFGRGSTVDDGRRESMMMEWSNCFWTRIRTPCCLPIGGWITAACPSLMRQADVLMGRTYGDVLRGE